MDVAYRTHTGWYGAQDKNVLCGGAGVGPPALLLDTMGSLRTELVPLRSGPPLALRFVSVGTQTTHPNLHFAEMGRRARGVEGVDDDEYDAQFPLLESLTFINSHLGGAIDDAEGREEPADELETAVTVEPESEPEALETEDIDDEPPLSLSVEELANADGGEGSMGEIRITLPSPDISCDLCKIHLGRVSQAVKHYTVRHNPIQLVFCCRKCGRTSNNSHSISCHAPKCRGRQENRIESLPWACEECPMRFARKVGLSQHKRHAHVTRRNMERISSARLARSHAVDSRKVWSTEETEALERLETKYAGQRNINVLIAGELGSKTGKQVGDKRRHIRLLADRDRRAEINVVDLEVASEPPRPRSGVQERLRDLARKRIEDAGGEQEANIPVIAAWLRDADQVTALVESSASSLIQMLNSGGAVTRRAARPRAEQVERIPERQPERSWMRTRAMKRGRYAKYQQMFARNTSKLSSLILDGTEQIRCRVPLEEVHTVFKDRWENRATFGGLGQFKSSGQADNGPFESWITAEEVRLNISRVKNSAATGPDRINKQKIVEMDPSGERLAEIFNTWLCTGIIPKVFKKGRTILIPKSMDQAELLDIGNWRPITIGSMILRLFSRIMTMRLARACPLNPRQRGFIPSPGCSENLKVLQDLIRHCKKERNPLAVVFVDFAKAFDSVSHEHILCALKQRNVDSHVVGIIQNSYEDCVTSVNVDGQETPLIDMKVGVKQGDPMSPLLFNLALDPLIHALESLGRGYKVGTSNLSTLAFADDLVMVSSSWDGMVDNIRILESFCRLTGLAVQARKCYGFMIKPTKDSFTVNDCQNWSIGGVQLQTVGPGEVVKYLGTKVDPWKGITEPTLGEQLQDWIGKIGRAPLKPTQKVSILNGYAVPRLIYLADHCDCKEGALKALDGLIRKAVKTWLHLPAYTCNGLLYSGPKDGGLGLTKLASLVPSIQVRRLHRIVNSTDEVTRNVVWEMGAEREFQRLWVKAGGSARGMPRLAPPHMEQEEAPMELPIPPVNRCPRPCDWRQDEYLAWTKLPVQGVGAQLFKKDRISNAWIRDYSGFRQRHYIAALQLRANVYPTRECLSRGRAGNLVACRQCRAEVESCSHILGQCPSVQGARIARHNKICDLLALEAERAGWNVHKEPHLRDENGDLRKPDLVFSKGRRALVVDVTVRFEFADDTLQRAEAEKSSYYSPLKPQIVELTGADQVQFFGFPMGARGKWPASNNRILQELEVGVARSVAFAKLVSRRTLLYSLDILAKFGNADIVYLVTV